MNGANADNILKPAFTPESSGVLKIYSRGFPAVVLLEIIGHALVLIESVHSSAFDGRDVHERIISAAFRRDKAITLVRIEEFYGSGDHMGILCPMYDGHAPTAAHPGYLRLERDKRRKLGFPKVRRMRRQPFPDRPVERDDQ